MAEANHPWRERLVLLNEELRGRAALQWEELDGIDRKASTILAGTGVVLALVINNARPLQETHASSVLFFIAVIGLAAALASGVFVLWPRRLDTVPAAQRLVDEYHSQSYDETLRALVATRARATETNRQTVEAKVRALKVQVAFFGVAAACLVVASLTQLLP